MKRIILLILISLPLASCDGFLEVGPNSSELDTELVFKNEETAIAALEALYHELGNNGFASGNTSSINFLGNILADDAKEYNNTRDRFDFYRNTIRSDNSSNRNIWVSSYKYLYNINALLEGITDTDNLSKTVIERIESEAKFLRAFIYYYLTHIYGEVPLVLSTDYLINQRLDRTSVQEIYTQIKTDLNEALAYLPENYIYNEGEHIRPTKYAAYTLIARLALWEGDYKLAIEYAGQVIDSNQYELVELNEIFKANSEEAIWQLIPIDPTIGAKEGYHYILENNPETAGAPASTALTQDFLSIWDQEDLRYTHWINVYNEGSNNYYYPFKYKIKAGGDTEEYSMVIRLAELYLIRAEAYAMSNEPEKSLADLNTIRNRAGLAGWSTSDISSIEEAVLEERRRELFSEWGHRWLDLKRFGKLDEVLGVKKTNWSSHAKLLPIPEQDLLRNPFLTQNPGY